MVRQVNHNLPSVVFMLNSSSERFLLWHQCRTRIEKWLPRKIFMSILSKEFSCVDNQSGRFLTWLETENIVLKIDNFVAILTNQKRKLMKSTGNCEQRFAYTRLSGSPKCRNRCRQISLELIFLGTLSRLERGIKIRCRLFMSPIKREWGISTW